MRVLTAGLLVVVSFFCADVHRARAAEPDPDCLKKMDTGAAFERKRFHVYQDTLRGFKDSAQASNAASVCGGALSRAETYYKRQVADKSVCVIGDSYVEQQVVALFKNATAACRNEFESFTKQLTPEEAHTVTQQVSQKEASIRPGVK